MTRFVSCKVLRCFTLDYVKQQGLLESIFMYRKLPTTLCKYDRQSPVYLGISLVLRLDFSSPAKFVTVTVIIIGAGYTIRSLAEPISIISQSALSFDYAVSVSPCNYHVCRLYLACAFRLNQRSRLKPGPARPGLVKPGRHSLITGPAGLQRLRSLKSGPSRSGSRSGRREPDRQSGAFEVTTVDVVT